MLCVTTLAAALLPSPAVLPSPEALASNVVDLHSRHHKHEHEHHKKEHKKEHHKKEHHTAPQAFGDAGSVSGPGSGSAACSEQGCWPSMYIIGVQKSGTTSLFDQMAHQGACGGGKMLKDKEAHFFDDTWPATGNEYIKRFGGSESQVHCKHNFYVDATPDYIRHWYAPQRMRELVPAGHQSAVRMVLLMREPVARDLSFFNHQLGNHMTDKREQKRPIQAGMDDSVCGAPFGQKEQSTTLSYSQYVACEAKIWQGCMSQSGGVRQAAYEACQCQMHRCSATGGATGKTYLTSGMYSAQIKRWSSVWPRHQMLAVQMEALLTSTPTYMGKIYHFLGFPAPIPQRLPDRNEKRYSFTVHSIPCSVKSKLKEIYEPWNAELYAMLKQDKASNAAHEMEPEFPAFPDDVSCHVEPNAVSLNGNPSTALQPAA